jgi:hypothetical protein
MQAAPRIRIRLIEPRAGDLAQLLEVSGAEVAIAPDGRGLEAVFPGGGPADLPDRVEGWLQLVDPGGGASLESDGGAGWQEGWRGVYRGALVGERFAVRPPWAPPVPGRLEVVIDPRGAFGSGLHPTTRAPLRLMERWLTPAETLDVGAGSGVLSIAAARLGCAVTAVELDPRGRAACARNAAANGVAVAVEERPLEALERRFPQIVANLPGPVLFRLADAILAAAAPGARLVLSGYRLRDRAGVPARFPGTVRAEVEEADYGAAVVDLPGGR